MDLSLRGLRTERDRYSLPEQVSALTRDLTGSRTTDRARLQEIEREKGAALKIADIHDQGAGVYRKVMLDGDMDGAWRCGWSGLIHAVPTLKKRIDRIKAEADRINRGRLMGLLHGTVELGARWRAAS
ncbi:hypothetical protein [Tardiphaga sp.]|uniref:hypothetical protein n=1 Tax=Tardiphaga sp. TaxID=1926292 RepID=UPI00352AA438